MTQKEFNTLLDKYLKRQCSPEEEKLINQWYQVLSHESAGDMPEPTDEIEARLWQSISQTTYSEGEQTVRKLATRRESISSWKWTGIAASILLFIAAGIYVLTMSKPSYQREGNGLVADQQVAPVIIQNTDIKMVKPVRLDDGSLVVLQPSSEIRILNLSQSGQREIKLSGEAFFDIAKDETRPFLVYSQELVIKVLGTSFNIRARQEDETIVVDVKTGKVAVFRENNISDDVPYFLTPNQQVIYNRGSDKIIQQLQENPQVIISETEIKKMEFDAAPVNTIFEALEEAYGVDLVFDQETFSKCQLTTRLTNEGLYERLQIICRALGATYETIGTKVHIQGTGCD